MNWRLIFLLCALAALPAQGDSLFTRQVERGGTLISEETARFDVGDIITVVVRERIDASTNADTRTKKESEATAESDPEDNTFFVSNDGLNIFNPEELPNWAVEIENEHKAMGATTRKSSLVTSVTCFVTEVYPNGNLMIEGHSQLTVNREDSSLHVAGVVRAEDITPSNTVQSTQIANATVSLQGKGPLWNNQRRGLFTKILDWFSPF